MTELTDEKGLLLPPQETPTPETLRALGDYLFLAERSDRHRSMNVGSFAETVMPPLSANQFRIFRFDGVPRAVFTWAWLSSDAEKRYVSGQLLRAGDWRSGERLWIIDMIAPYRGLTSSIARWIMIPGNVTKSDFRFRRIRDGKATRRIVHVDFNRPGQLAAIETDADYL